MSLLSPCTDNDLKYYVNRSINGIYDPPQWNVGLLPQKEAAALKSERARIADMPDGPEKDAAMAKLAEDEAHAALKAEEARKLELYEEHREYRELQFG